MAVATKSTDVIKKFRIKEGEHNIKITRPDEDVPVEYKKYTKGQVIKSRDDLEALYPNKFERVFDDLDVANPEDFLGVDQPDDATSGVQLDVDRLADEVKKQSLPAVAAGLAATGWKNVTEDFPKAIEAGVLVWKKMTKYKVTDSDETVLTGEPLNKLAVPKFISEL